MFNSDLYIFKVLLNESRNGCKQNNGTTGKNIRLGIGHCAWFDWILPCCTWIDSSLLSVVFKWLITVLCCHTVSILHCLVLLSYCVYVIPGKYSQACLARYLHGRNDYHKNDRFSVPVGNENVNPSFDKCSLVGKWIFPKILCAFLVRTSILLSHIYNVHI